MTPISTRAAALLATMTLCLGAGFAPAYASESDADAASAGTSVQNDEAAAPELESTGETPGEEIVVPDPVDPEPEPTEPEPTEPEPTEPGPVDPDPGSTPAPEVDPESGPELVETPEVPENETPASGAVVAEGKAEAPSSIEMTKATRADNLEATWLVPPPQEFTVGVRIDVTVRITCKTEAVAYPGYTVSLNPGGAKKTASVDCGQGRGTYADFDFSYLPTDNDGTFISFTAHGDANGSDSVSTPPAKSYKAGSDHKFHSIEWAPNQPTTFVGGDDFRAQVILKCWRNGGEPATKRLQVTAAGYPQWDNRVDCPSDGTKSETTVTVIFSPPSSADTYQIYVGAEGTEYRPATDYEYTSTLTLTRVERPVISIDWVTPDPTEPYKYTSPSTIPATGNVNCKTDDGRSLTGTFGYGSDNPAVNGGRNVTLTCSPSGTDNPLELDIEIPGNVYGADLKEVEARFAHEGRSPVVSSPLDMAWDASHPLPLQILVDAVTPGGLGGNYAKVGDTVEVELRAQNLNQGVAPDPMWVAYANVAPGGRCVPEQPGAVEIVPNAFRFFACTVTITEADLELRSFTVPIDVTGEFRKGSTETAPINVSVNPAPNLTKKVERAFTVAAEPIHGLFTFENDPIIMALTVTNTGNDPLGNLSLETVGGTQNARCYWLPEMSSQHPPIPVGGTAEARCYDEATAAEVAAGTASRTAKVVDNDPAHAAAAVTADSTFAWVGAASVSASAVGGDGTFAPVVGSKVKVSVDVDSNVAMRTLDGSATLTGGSDGGVLRGPIGIAPLGSGSVDLEYTVTAKDIEDKRITLTPGAEGAADFEPFQAGPVAARAASLLAAGAGGAAGAAASPSALTRAYEETFSVTGEPIVLTLKDPGPGPGPTPPTPPAPTPTPTPTPSPTSKSTPKKGTVSSTGAEVAGLGAIAMGTLALGMLALRGSARGRRG